MVALRGLPVRWRNHSGSMAASSDRVNLGVGLGVRIWSADFTDIADDGTLLLTSSTTQIGFTLEPSARFYLRTTTPVKPFMLTGAGYSFDDRDATLDNAPRDDDDSYTWFARLAAGAEWFPARSVSFAVWTGLQLSRLVLDRATPSGATSRTSRIDLATAVGALTAQIYF